MMKFILFWAIGILIPIIGLQAQKVIDDMVIIEDGSTSSRCSPVPTNHTCYFDGRSRQKRLVINGEDAPRPDAKGGYPFMAAIMIEKDKFQCGGTLIDESHILTAAHCFYNDTRFTVYDMRKMRIYLGAHNIRYHSGSVHRVKRMIMHKDYIDRFPFYNDIAILTLETPARMSKSVKPICLPNRRYSTFANQRVTVTGWGALNEEGTEHPSVLQEADLDVISNAQCARKYRGRALIKDSTMCTEEVGKDACYGDSGGPIHLVQSGVTAQVGIVSWGWGCALANSPGVYTRVTAYSNWIQRVQNCY